MTPATTHKELLPPQHGECSPEEAQEFLENLRKRHEEYQAQREKERQQQERENGRIDIHDSS